MIGGPAVDHWFRESERVWDSAHVHLQRAVRRHKANSDTRRSTNPIYQPGDRVWLSTRDIHLRLPCKKLSPWYIGPFRVMRRINEVNKDDILDPSLINDFHQAHPNRPAPRGRGRPRRRSQASGDARGGGGNVTEQPASSIESTTYTRSQSPEY